MTRRGDDPECAHPRVSRDGGGLSRREAREASRVRVRCPDCGAVVLGPVGADRSDD